MKPSFWHNKTVLITGHTGFKGSWLSLWLQKLGARVIGYALSPPTQPNLFEIASVATGMISIQGDVRDLEQLNTVINQYRPDIVIHLAAQSLVRYAYQHPVETYATNIMGTVNLLEAVKKSTQTKVIVNVTSDKCYDNREWIWGYRENEPMGGSDPYSSSKGCAELITAAYCQSFFNPNTYSEHGVAIATARAGNVIGGGDWAQDRLIPDILNSWISKQTVLIRYPNAIRPWQLVLEPLNGYLTLAEHLYEQGTRFNGAWNFGPNDSDAKPVSWIVEQLKALWADQANWELDQTAHPHEAHYLKLDCSKARTQLDWQPKLDIKTALTWVVNWTQAWQTGKNMRDISEQQIERFMALSQ
ncbi:MAG TPA: CDP-glucose 4,6-dehydratase [Thiotrichaceae bacterium]|nr:CDP-glucose 4,6-dehydratase [Thiotrichaceae bacterium]